MIYDKPKKAYETAPESSSRAENQTQGLLRMPDRSKAIPGPQEPANISNPFLKVNQKIIKNRCLWKDPFKCNTSRALSGALRGALLPSAWLGFAFRVLTWRYVSRASQQHRVVTPHNPTHATQLVAGMTVVTVP